MQVLRLIPSYPKTLSHFQTSKNKSSEPASATLQAENHLTTHAVPANSVFYPLVTRTRFSCEDPSYYQFHGHVGEEDVEGEAVIDPEPECDEQEERAVDSWMDETRMWVEADDSETNI